MKIYTRSGDRGTTSLVGGERVAKCDLRVEAYGTVDELIAFIALFTDKMRSEERLNEICPKLERINGHLMTVSALLAIGKGGETKVAQLPASAIEELEREIDTMTDELSPITKFTLPGGNVLVSLCHVCRTICRRAERASLRAAEAHPISPETSSYLNRLSDWFYTLGRLITLRLEVEEILWIP